MDVACKIVADVVAQVTADACATVYATIEAAHVQANAARFAGRLSLAAGAFAIVAAAVAFSATMVQSSRQENSRLKQRGEKARALRAAFLAEIEALNDVIRHRRYFGYLEDIARAYEEGRDVPLEVPTFNNDGMVPWPVFAASVDKVGLLNPQEAAAITRYYGAIRSIRASWAFVERGGLKDRPLADKAAFIQSDLALYRAAVDAVAHLSNESPTQPKRSLWSMLYY